MLKPLLLCLLAAFATQDPRDEPDPVDLKAETIALAPEQIICFAIGTKGKVIYSADAKNSLRAWSIDKGEFLWETDPMPGLGQIHDIAPTERSLITFVGAPTYQLWDLKDGSSKDGATTAIVKSGATCMVAEPKGKWLWLGYTRGGALRLQPGNIAGHSSRGDKGGGTWGLALDAKAKQLALASEDGTVRFINPLSTKIDDKKIFKVHTSKLTAVAFGHKGKKLAVGAGDGTLKLIELKKGKELMEFKGHEAEITKLAIDPKGRWLVSGDIEGNLFMWNLKDGKEPAKLGVRARGPVAGIYFLDKGDTLMTTSGNQSVQVWDLSELDD